MKGDSCAVCPDFEYHASGSLFVTLYPDPDIRLNLGDPITGQTGRLFLPADFMVGRDLTKSITMSLEIGAPRSKTTLSMI